MSAQRTYSHLGGQARDLPSEYAIVTSRLHYYTGRGFEVNVPLGDWYRTHQTESPLQCRDWDAFVDPRQTTYTKYTRIQREREAEVAARFDAIEATGYDRQLSAEWLDALGASLPALRYPCHALQMIAAYVGQMAPSGRVTLAAAFQAADELRRVEGLARRLRQLQLVRPEIGGDAQRVWQDDPRWQPLRKVMEQLLVTYDFGEAFVALNLCVKPILDELIGVEWAFLAMANSDRELAGWLTSVREDTLWHRSWSAALMRLVIADRPGNRPVLGAWSSKWFAAAFQAVDALAPYYTEDPDRAMLRIINAHHAYLGEIGIEGITP